MPVELHISLNGDGAWPDMLGKEIIQIQNEISIAALSGGMTSGRPSVAIKIDLPDGRVVFAQTSMRNFLACAAMFAARYSSELGE